MPLRPSQFLASAAVAAILLADDGARAGPIGDRAAAATDSLRIYYVGKAVGWERYTIAPEADGVTMTADLDYIDRGRRTHTESSTSLSADYAPRRLEVARVTDTSRTVTVRVEIAGRRATIAQNGTASEVELPPAAFALAPYLPVSQHLALLRYWRLHGAPATLAVVPGGPINQVVIARRGTDTLTSASHRSVLTRYSIDGVVWGIEYLWLDEEGRLAMFTTAAGGLSTKALRAELVPDYEALMTIATMAAMTDLVKTSSHVRPTAEGSLALTGATLIDGSGRDAVRDATIVVSRGRIVAAGSGPSVSIPAGVRRIDVRGKTVVPGLWDSHAHLHQLEWPAVYLAAGVTTVRDMGNEIPFITALRHTIESGRAYGPRIVLAGLVDGPGPNAFGAVSVATPAEGRAIVRRYHELGFEEMKLYDLLTPDVVAAICDEAHKNGMIVSGHVPRALPLLAAIDSGMDHVAHLAIRASPRTDTLDGIIAHLVAHKTVLDPTASWGEIGGHSMAEPLQNFQPVTQHLPAVFLQTRASGWGSAAVDTAAAHARLARSLAIIGALHRAGVPIIAGTDEGVPGFSIYREMELYVMAGMTPMDAIRAATAVPARAMHLDREVGTLEPGMRADLLVLDANPLDGISNIRSVRLVMRDGRVYESAALWRAAGFRPD